MPTFAFAQGSRRDAPTDIHVDAKRGKAGSKGTERQPVRTLAAALTLLPDPVLRTTRIHLAPGTYGETGDDDGESMPSGTLHLMRRMRPGVHVDFVVHRSGKGDGDVVFDWHDHTHAIATEGEWRFRGIRFGSFRKDQRRGIDVRGPGHVVLQDVSFRLRSQSDAAVWARYGGRVTLEGDVLVNEHLHDAADDESFSGFLATEHGIIEYGSDRDGALELGNGSLSVRTYGIIRLGCQRARITCWTKSNNLTINNGGRIDVRNTTVTLCAKVKNNTPIGLEHDGHILAEDAVIHIEGANDSAIALQKASTFTCNDIDLRGEFEYSIWASSGSMFVGRFLGNVAKVKASTGAGIHIEKIGGELRGPVEARSGGVVSLPDRTVRSK
ncbi:MAG: hypothetical protein KDC95_12290 [Planctomycetes bacterium]|nr:hypothetical protein [Planctomycetota bacterium]